MITTSGFDSPQNFDEVIRWHNAVELALVGKFALPDVRTEINRWSAKAAISVITPVNTDLAPAFPVGNVLYATIYNNSGRVVVDESFGGAAEMPKIYMDEPTEAVLQSVQGVSKAFLKRFGTHTPFPAEIALDYTTAVGHVEIHAMLPQNKRGVLSGVFFAIGDSNLIDAAIYLAEIAKKTRYNVDDRLRQVVDGAYKIKPTETYCASDFDFPF